MLALKVVTARAVNARAVIAMMLVILSGYFRSQIEPGVMKDTQSPMLTATF